MIVFHEALYSGEASSVDDGVLFLSTPGLPLVSGQVPWRRGGVPSSLCLHKSSPGSGGGSWISVLGVTLRVK